MEKLLQLLNVALSMEHSAAIQYGAHAESVHGLFADTIMARLKDSQHDEEKHADVLRGLIGDYLKGVPTMEIVLTTPAMAINSIITVNIATEKEAVAQYQSVLEFMEENKAELLPIYERVRHDVRKILREEQKHIAELERLQ